MKTRICLNMIVRDEAAVIERCLASVRPFIDAWVIVDTGSKDATPQLVRQALDGVPGELHERPWRDFGHNRSEALQLARGAGDYLLFIDADETLEAPQGFSWPALEAPAYHLYAEYKGTRYSRPALLDARLDWRWEGVLHEFPVATPAVGFAQLEWPRITVRQDGARSRDPRKLHNDIEVLREAIAREPQNARYVFYLAQTYRDAGELERARDTYWQRSRMQGWDEEAWYAIYQVARVTERLGASTPEVQAAYLYAYHQRPTRAEPLFHLGRFHNERREHALAFLFARPAAEMALPPDVLFVEEDVYRWRALDEMSVAAAACGARAAAQWAMERLVREGQLPAPELARVQANLAKLR
ncbi:MAG TPA: glycosyltransferase [Usitatibacter sp.]|jgi:glycosyltransferase involved in cell wall biosynthesis|nr:glycosyltransferase [Usitatibacter sp.]